MGYLRPIQCVEDLMAGRCAVCRSTAEIARQMTQAGVRTPARFRLQWMQSGRARATRSRLFQ